MFPTITLLLLPVSKLSSTLLAQKTLSLRLWVILLINFLLSVIGLNGVPPQDSDDISTSLGGIYYGASIECTITDIDGSTSLSKSGQLPQSSYTPLELPYMFIGLGRTNNYIENFVMGIAMADGPDVSYKV